jgi:hypothetical protein
MATILKAGNVATGAQITSDATGILEIRTGTGAGTTAITVGTNQAVTMGAVSSSSLTVNSNNISAVNSLGFRNRIINGAMVIDQRNAGASVSISGLVNTYTLDRWLIRNDTEAVVSVQQSSTAPTGFNNSLLYTVTTADTSLGATQNHSIQQRIEGFNMADFGWGTANAQTVTLSFWVRSSLTGTFGGAISNSAANRSYPFSYTISAANTFEYKTITIVGDTTGTWITTNGIGAYIYLSTGAGSSVSGTAGAWAGSDFRSATGATSVVGTNGATFYITGVQLEAGSVATPFERRDYGRELMMAQRYYYKNFPALSNNGLAPSFNGSTTQSVGTGFFPVQMRVRPTALEQTGTASDYVIAHRATSTVCSSVPVYDGVTNQNLYSVVFTVSSGLTAGDGSQLRTNSTNGFLAWSAEL